MCELCDLTWSDLDWQDKAAFVAGWLILIWWAFSPMWDSDWWNDENRF